MDLFTSSSISIITLCWNLPQCPTRCCLPARYWRHNWYAGSKMQNMLVLAKMISYNCNSYNRNIIIIFVLYFVVVHTIDKAKNYFAYFCTMQHFSWHKNGELVSQNGKAMIQVPFACRISLILAKSSKNQFYYIVASTVEGNIQCTLKRQSMSYDDICLFAHDPV